MEDTSARLFFDAVHSGSEAKCCLTWNAAERLYLWWCGLLLVGLLRPRSGVQLLLGPAAKTRGSWCAVVTQLAQATRQLDIYPCYHSPFTSFLTRQTARGACAFHSSPPPESNTSENGREPTSGRPFPRHPTREEGYLLRDLDSWSAAPAPCSRRKARHPQHCWRSCVTDTQKPPTTTDGPSPAYLSRLRGGPLPVEHGPGVLAARSRPRELSHLPGGQTTGGIGQSGTPPSRCLLASCGSGQLRQSRPPSLRCWRRCWSPPQAPLTLAPHSHCRGISSSSTSAAAARPEARPTPPTPTSVRPPPA